jgi:hypothetical protein
MKIIACRADAWNAWGEISAIVQATAFSASSGSVVAAAYLEEAGGEHRYRYAVVCGGEAGKRALRDASLDPGDEI